MERTQQQKERLTLLASYLRSIPKKRFRMDKWLHFKGMKPGEVTQDTPECGSAGCIAGSSVMLARSLGIEDTPELYRFMQSEAGETVESFGRRFLHLETAEANDLFMAGGVFDSLRDVSKKDAVGVLTAMLDGKAAGDAWRAAKEAKA